MCQGPDIESLKVELTSESDLFFHYTHIANEETFRAMQAEQVCVACVVLRLCACVFPPCTQKLMVDFADYANVLARSLNSAIKEPHR